MTGKGTKKRTGTEIQSQIDNVELSIKRRQTNINEQRLWMFDEQAFLARLKTELLSV